MTIHRPRGLPVATAAAPVAKTISRATRSARLVILDDGTRRRGPERRMNSSVRCTTGSSRYTREPPRGQGVGNDVTGGDPARRARVGGWVCGSQDLIRQFLIMFRTRLLEPGPPWPHDPRPGPATSPARVGEEPPRS